MREDCIYEITKDSAKRAGFEIKDSFTIQSEIYRKIKESKDKQDTIIEAKIKLFCSRVQELEKEIEYYKTHWIPKEVK